MGLIEVIVLRLLLWVCVPVVLLVLLIGPARCGQLWHRFWSWLLAGWQEPSAVLERVLTALQKHIQDLQQVLKQAETAQAEIVKNRKRSEDNCSTLEMEARQLLGRGDEQGAREALAKLHLEQLAVHSFQQHQVQQQQRIAHTRRRLHLMELQLRQYEVGRSILLSQLAEARTVEQQYALINQFDPYGALAEWQKAEGTVKEETQNARAVEQVYNDTADMPLSGQPLRIDPALIDAQLAELKAQTPGTNGKKK